MGMDITMRLRVALGRVMLVDDIDDVPALRMRLEMINDPRVDYERRMVEGFEALIEAASLPQEGL